MLRLQMAEYLVTVAAGKCRAQTVAAVAVQSHLELVRHLQRNRCSAVRQLHRR